MNKLDTILTKNNVELHHSFRDIDEKNMIMIYTHTDHKYCHYFHLTKSEQKTKK